LSEEQGEKESDILGFYRERIPSTKGNLGKTRKEEYLR